MGTSCAGWKKNHCFEALSSLTLHNNKAFLNWIVMCNEKWILQDNQRGPAQCLDLYEPSKHFPKTKHGHGHCLVAFCPCDLLSSFLNPRKTITSEKYPQQFDEMHWKLQHLQLALVNRKAQFFSTTITTECCTTNSSKVELIGLWSFDSSARFTWPLANQLPLLQASEQLFAGKVLPKPGGAGNTF